MRSIKQEQDNLLWRLENTPEEFTDGDLKILASHHGNSRGNLYPVATKCGMILDKRATPPKLAKSHHLTKSKVLDYTKTIQGD